MINKRTDNGETALLIAISRRHVSCAQELLEKGADPDLPNHEKETPLFKGKGEGSDVTDDCGQITGPSPLSNFVFPTACERSSAEMVAVLLNHGAAVNTHCLQGWTALQQAVFVNNVEICEMLLKSGAKHNVTNMYGITPLFTAAQTGQVATLRFLIQHGEGATPSCFT